MLYVCIGRMGSKQHIPWPGPSAKFLIRSMVRRLLATDESARSVSSMCHCWLQWSVLLWMGPFSAFMSGKKINYIHTDNAVEPYRLLGVLVFFLQWSLSLINMLFLKNRKEKCFNLSVSVLLYCKTIRFRTYGSYFPLSTQNKQAVCV